MSDIFAEATVRISPSLTGFVKDLEDDLKKTMAKVKVPPVRVGPALEIGFIGKLKTQVNTAIDSVQKQVKPIRVRVLIDIPSRRALQEVVSGAPVSLPGAVTPAGRGAGFDQQVNNERLLASLRAQGARDLGLVEVAEDKATAARDRSTASTKRKLTSEQRAERFSKLTADATKILADREFTAATATGELAQKKKELGVVQQALNKQLEAAALASSQELRGGGLRRQIEDTKRIRSLLLDEIREIEARATAPAAATGLTSAQRTARATGAAALRTAVETERLAAAAFAQTGTQVKDLAKQKDILTKRTDALTAANKAARVSEKAGSDTLRVASLAAQSRLKIQVEQSKELVRSLGEQQKAADRAARSEKRRSEQLSRGGQASILSLAGIRGATLAASRSFLAGAAAVTVFANAVRQFADLERNLHVFEATTSATHSEMEAVREEARLLGADLTLPAVTAEEAAGAMVELAKAGLSVTDSMDAARAVLELATAAAIDNAEATRLVANVLNAFSLAGTDATAVADTLANAANAAQGSIADIGTAFQQAASAGRQVGLSFQDTAVFLTILAKNGIRGSDAGTSLRTALIRLINPSKNAKERFRELGISIHDAAGNLRPDVFLQIAAATKEMSPAMRDATIAMIGGQDAFRAVTILGRQSIDTFLEMRKALREEGTAAELAAARTKGLHGSIDALQSVVETVGTTMASHLGPGIAGFVYQLGRGVTALSESNELATALEQSVAGLAAAFDLLGHSLKVLGFVALPVATIFGKIATSFGVGAILGGALAYKVLGGAIERARKTSVAARAAYAALGTTQAVTNGVTESGIIVVESFNKAQATAVTRGVKLRAALAAAAKSLNLYLLAATAATAIILHFALGETEAERATRRFKKATDELIDSLEERNRLRAEARDAPLQVNAARLSVLEAERAARQAQGALRGSDAAAGTFKRIQLELQLAVALDNVEIAQNAYNDALTRASEARRAADVATTLARKKRDEEISSLNAVIDAELEAAKAASIGQRGPEVARIELVAREKIAEAIQEQIDLALEENSIESRAFADRLEFLQQTTSAIENLPDGVVNIVLRSPNLKEAAKDIQAALREAGDESGAVMVESILLKLGILPKRLKDFLDAGEIKRAIAESLVPDPTDIESAAERVARIFSAALKRSLGRQRGFEIQEDLAAIASGATGATLPSLQDQLAEATRQRALAEARIADLTEDKETSGLATAREARAKAISDQRRLTEEIRGINEQLGNEAKAAASEAEEKQNEIFENILKAMGLKRDAQQERIEDAELSEGLADNIRQTQILRNIAAKQIQNLKDRIARARAQGKNVEVLTKALDDLKDLWRDLGREIVDLRNQQQKALRDILFERFELRIQIAQARGNVAAEIRARRARLEELTKELVRMRRAFGKNSIEWLRAKAAQVEEIEAIKELEKSTKTKNSALRELMFEFLTTQQGFAANLLGNLLPIGAIGGTVGARMDARAAAIAAGGGGGGGGAGAAGRIGANVPHGAGGTGGAVVPGPAAAAATAGAGAIAAPTRGQASTTNQLLHQILNVLRNTNQREKNPSSRRQAKTGNAANDTQ
jgi:TP901 family phage tail tape measure protein